MANLIDHIEQYLGIIQGGYSKGENGEELPFQVVHCPRGIETLRTFCTIGLSRFPLEYNGRRILQELMIVILDKFDVQNAPGLLIQVGIRALERGRAFGPGEIISGPNEMFEGKPFKAFYTTTPGFMPDEFILYNAEDGSKIMFAILLPITPEEEKYIIENGFQKFEDLFIDSGIDMLDLDRPSLV
jgi:hypothetical protein